MRVGLTPGPIAFSTPSARDATSRGPRRLGMDVAFIATLLATDLTGLALLILRDTDAMDVPLAVHLGFVSAVFLGMPYGRFVPGIYRFAALTRYARERRIAETTLSRPHPSPRPAAAPGSSHWRLLWPFPKAA